MNFKTAHDVEDVIWALKLADIPRQENRARIDNLFNGAPPYTPREQEQNRFTTNVNDLSPNRIFHDSTRQFSNAFLKPGNFFQVKLDYGPEHKRDTWGRIITREINRQMKRSQMYRQTLRNVFAQLVLHGVGPVVWPDKYFWCPAMQMMCDVLIPSNTLLTMENLGYFAVYRRYTAAQLEKLTRGPKVDPGWNKDIVNGCLAWVSKQTGTTLNAADQNWVPERMAEDIKSNSAFFSSDAVPTVNCWDVYVHDDEAKESGWKRRIILDIPSQSEAEGADEKKITRDTKNIIGGRNQFLYSSNSRNYAAKLSEIIHFQFADGSVVAPYRYHSVRSLGFLLYALCHLHNRLRCRLTDSTFENLLNYIRVNSIEDAERLKKVDLINQGFLPEGWQFVSQAERWQINQQLVQMMINLMRQDMAESSPSYNQQFGQGENNQIEKTATQITAEIQKATSTIGTILQESYGYQEFQYQEIARRFCKADSKDPDVRKFRVNCINDGVPIEALNVDRWTISAERVMGNGNKQLEIAQAQMIMQQYPVLDPDGQRVAVRNYLFAVTDDPALVDRLKPETPNLVTDSVHDAEISAGSLLLGIPMGLRQGVNHGEYAATLLGVMNTELKKIEASGNVGGKDDVAGLINLAGITLDGQPIDNNGANNHIQILAQDKTQKQMVKQLSDVLGKLMNQVKALAQRQQEQQAQPQNGNELSPETAAKLKGTLIIAQAKAQNMRESHAQRMTQRQQTHEAQLEQDRSRSQLENANEIRRAQVDESVKDIQTAGELLREIKKPEQNGNPVPATP